MSKNVALGWGILTGIAIGICWSVASHAECLQWGRTLNGNYRVCMTDDAVNRNPVVPETSIMGPPGVTITNTPAPKCPEGYVLILRSPGNPACAQHVIDPE